MTTTTTTKALTCDPLVLSSVVDNNNNNSRKIDSRRIRAKRRRRGEGENGDLNANGLIGLLALCCLCFCCLISASSGFVIPAPKSSSSASSSHLSEADVSRHGPLPAIQRLNHSETVPNNNSSNKSSPVGSLSADSSQNTRQRPKRHILPAQQQQQQPNHHHHHQSSSSSSASESSLPINVRNGGGEVFRQVISANTDADYIRLEFTDTDGSLVRTLVDFRNNLQIFRLVRLGEQDLNERRWTTYCFITVLPPDEYISADAMSKLTQKNPATIRQAELDHGSALYNMDLKLKDEGERDYPEGSKLSSSNYDLHLLSPHLRNFCEHAQGRVYASEEDLLRWRTNESDSPGGSAAVRSFANVSSLFSRLNSPSSAQNSSSSAALSVPEFRQCGELLAKLYQNFSSSSWQNSSSSSSSLPLGRSSDEALARHFLAAHQGELCHCSLSLVLPFYPCSVRHCTAPDPANPGKVVNYRCGIRTCRRRYEFRFAVADKLACLSDFDPTVKLSSADSADGSVDLQKEVVDEERMANNPQEADGNGKDTGDGEADPPLADNSVAANSKQV